MIQKVDSVFGLLFNNAGRRRKLFMSLINISRFETFLTFLAQDLTPILTGVGFQPAGLQKVLVASFVE